MTSAQYDWELSGSNLDHNNAMILTTNRACSDRHLKKLVRLNEKYISQELFHRILLKVLNNDEEGFL